MEINCNLLARGLAKVDEQTNVDASSCLISRVRCHVILQGRSHLRRFNCHDNRTI